MKQLDQVKNLAEQFFSEGIEQVVIAHRKEAYFVLLKRDRIEIRSKKAKSKHYTIYELDLAKQTLSVDRHPVMLQPQHPFLTLLQQSVKDLAAKEALLFKEEVSEKNPA